MTLKVMQCFSKIICLAFSQGKKELKIHTEDLSKLIFGVMRAVLKSTLTRRKYVAWASNLSQFLKLP